MKFLSLIYGFAVFIRNKLYDWKILKIKEVENVEIICIGNIVAGGSGKTPAVQYFVKKYLKEGRKVAVLSRGYKGKRKKDTMSVTDGEKLTATPLQAGDEAYLHALNLKVPVAVSGNRYEGAIFLRDNYKIDIIIMDDGFQHRKLKKNKNIVLIDATNPFGGNNYLPKGRLRESVDSLKRADEIIITKSNYVKKETVNFIADKVKKYGKPVFVAVFKEGHFYDCNGRIFKLEEVKDRKILVFSSIANPETFYNTMKNLEPKKIDEIKFADHHIYSDEEIEEIYREGKNYDYIVTTEKDIVKINKNMEKLLVLKMEFEIIGKK